MARDGIGVDSGWVSTDKGEHLRRRRVKDTKPELSLRSAVHRMGLRFRLQRKLTPRCTADFVLPRYHVAVFVDGCFWHGCPEHGPKQFRGPNAKRWKDKLETNRERDKRNTKAVEAAGWTVVRIWECEIRSDVGRAALKVAERCFADHRESTPERRNNLI